MTAAALHNTVRSHGLRVSSARRGVLDRLLGADQPLTAEEIAGDGDIASVYRNLVTLETIGVVRRLRAARGPSRYALSERCKTCPACGRSDYN
jgi:Fur family ferric uptake transcriptional regulator